MNLQKTNFNSLLRFLERFLYDLFAASWRRRSLGLISLLIGFYFSSSLTVYLLETSGKKTVVVILFLLLIEFLTRLRKYNENKANSIYVLVLDNSRIGMTYGIVLEAFKLGS